VVFGLIAGAGLPAIFAAGMVIAALCFLVVLAAIGWGVYEVYQIGHPATHK
jgi:hypothetical protein